MTNAVRDILLVESLNISNLIEDYRLFFLGLLPSVFILAVIIEYFDRMEPFALCKRALVSILILTSVTSFYTKSIDASINVANEILQEQKSKNILLMNMLDGNRHWNELQDNLENKKFYKDKNVFSGTLSFIKYHFFEKFINNGFTVGVYFLAGLLFVILKLSFSFLYYVGYGLIGIPCLIYLFPSMGNVLRGGILVYLLCLIIPHILVFNPTMIGSEINQGYATGNIIGGSIMGTALLFGLCLFIGLIPVIGWAILAGSGISQASAFFSTMGTNFVIGLPLKAANTAATVLTGGKLGAKTTIAGNTIGSGVSLAGRATKALGSKIGLKSKPGTNQLQKESSIQGKDKVSSSSIQSSDSLKSSSKSNSSSQNKTESKGFKNFNVSSEKIKNTNKENKKAGGKIGKISKHNRINSESKKTTESNHDRRNTRKSSRSSSRTYKRKLRK